MALARNGLWLWLAGNLRQSRLTVLDCWRLREDLSWKVLRGSGEGCKKTRLRWKGAEAGYSMRAGRLIRLQQWRWLRWRYWFDVWLARIGKATRKRVRLALTDARQLDGTR